MDLKVKLDQARTREAELSKEVDAMVLALSEAEKNRMPHLAASLRPRLKRWQAALEMATALVRELEAAVGTLPLGEPTKAAKR